MSKRFPQGMLAVNAEHISAFVDAPPKPLTTVVNNVAIVPIRGALMHHADLFLDSYDEIKERVATALLSSPKAVVLAIDSPGGLMSGMIDTAREIKALALAAGIPLYSYVDGGACSAAYALATIGEKIFVPETGEVGSIGVLDARLDISKQNQAYGIRYEFITSGARKADGNPNLPITDEELIDRQQKVDAFCNIFFSFVCESRAVSMEQLHELQARTTHGQEAVKMGLADAVCTLDEVIALVSGAGATVTTAQNEGTMEEYEKAVAALRKMAEGDDECAQNAKKMLAALEPPEEKDDEKSGEAEDDHKEPDGDEPPAKAESDKDDDGKSAKAMASQALAAVTSLKTEQERKELLATRPDLPLSLIKTLSKSGTPISMVREIVKDHPRGQAPKPAATSVLQGTRGEGQANDARSNLSGQAQAMDLAMGITAHQGGVRKEGNSVTFGVMSVDSAKEHIKKNGGTR